MKNYKFAGGQIIDRESGAAAPKLHGMLTSVAVEETDKGTRYLHLVLTDGEDKVSLRVKLYGDMSLKILRCLYGVVATLNEAPVALFFEEREEQKNLLHVQHGGNDLPEIGVVPPYNDLRAGLIQRLTTTVKTAVESRFPVTVIAITVDGRDVVFDDPAAEEVAQRIREAITQGRRGNVKLRKHTFSTPSLVKAFLDGARALCGERIYVTEDPENIALLDEAWAFEPADENHVIANPEDNDEA